MRAPSETSGTGISRTLADIRACLVQQASFGLGRVPRPTAFDPVPRASTSELAELDCAVSACRSCRLSEGRRTAVFGSGSPDAGVMFIGEAPGAEEDRQGLPFVSAAGRLLTRMIDAIGMDRDTVFIANIIKCRPPGNRDPQADEVAACWPHLSRQIEIIRPVVICALGRFAAQTLLDTDAPMGKLRGRLFDYQGIKLIPTYHPAALLRNQQWKRPAWEDLKRLRLEYDGVTL